MGVKLEKDLYETTIVRHRGVGVDFRAGRNGVGYSSSIRDGGVRRKQIDLTQPHWTVIDIDADPAKVLALYERTAGEPYGWLDLLTQQVLRLPVSSAGWFCSEWAAKAIGLTDPEIWSPGMLARHYGVT